MALTDTAIKKFKYTGKASGDKLTDGGGMYLLVNATGKYWRMNYRHEGKQKTLAFGVYPDVPLALARKRREEARALLATGVDPGAAKKAAKQAGAEAAANTFEAIAREFHARQASGWSAVHASRWIRDMEKDMFPRLGDQPLASITAPMLLAALRRVEDRGALEVVHNLRQQSGQVFRYGVATGRCERDPAADLRGALKPLHVKHMAAVLEPVKVGELLRAMDGYTGQAETKAALQLSALLFQRPINIRAMEWAWIDLDKAMLTIPAMAMKRRLHGKINGRPHFVPLARQAVEILRNDMQPLTGRGRYVFPSVRTHERPMSSNTVLGALRRMGYTGDEMTAHGFRAMARTVMAENLPGINPEVVEAQLAHGKDGALGDTYDRAEYMAQRARMMQVWADYLDRLRKGADVIPFPVKVAA
jgi:integrase